METIVSRPVLLMTALLGAGAANAEWRCDCTQIVASCTAQVSIQGNWVEVTSDHQQCARVDYFIEGLPFVALVVDGVERQNWIARTEQPEVLVQSCQVCQDNASDAPPVPAAATRAQDDDALTPIIEVSPEYPSIAQAQGLEGYVELSFTVTPSGTVTNPVVTASAPERVFDDAAVAALSQWRYRADPDREPTTLNQRIDFNLSDYILGLPAGRDRGGRGAVQTNRTDNACVREQSAYNYGDQVEIDLMNACAEPLLVFSCAVGTGQYSSRWVCTDSEQRRGLLVPPSDSRIDETTAVQTPAGSRIFRFEDELLVTRAPNSEYWWLACTLGDSACRESGRAWLRSIDRQLASIDPQSRATRSLGRSY